MPFIPIITQRILKFILVGILLSFLGSVGFPNRSANANDVGKLVVVISVDQMRADYLVRFKKEFRKGFRRLLRQGAVLTQAHQNHALTYTGPGHSTLLTGLVPGRNGIIANQWYDRSKGAQVYCVGSETYKVLGSDRQGASPDYLKATTLGDWLKGQSPDSKVISLSRKDRAAVLMGGKHPDQVYWFDSLTGQFVTSDYYARRYPAWYTAWKDQGVIDSYFGVSWEKLSKKPLRYSLSDPDTSIGRYVVGTSAFPHKFNSKTGKPDSSFYHFIGNTPFFDEITLKYAEAAIRGEKLGKRGVTDLLAIGLSVTDSIGHTYGPDSEEIHDQILRLDQYLGDFLKTLRHDLGSKNFVVVLTADHGVMPLPELVRDKRLGATRVGRDLMLMRNQLQEYLVSHLGSGQWIAYGPSGGGFYFHTRRADGVEVPLDKVVETAIQFLKNQPLVAEYFTHKDLESSGGDSSKYRNLFRNSFNPERSPDLLLRLPPYALPLGGRIGTTHGSCYDYDTHVPLIFWGKPFKRGKQTQACSTVDIAPTLCGVLGIVPPAGLDGQPLGFVIKSPWSMATHGK